MPQAKIDVSDRALCDDCDSLFTAASPEAGGILFQSKAICPACAPKWEKSAADYGEEHFIRDRARAGETFFDAVMRRRNGNNTVTITGDAPFVEDMRDSYAKRLGR